MPRLDGQTLDLLITTLRDYAARELPAEVLRDIDRRDEFPARVLADFSDPRRIGLHLLSIPEEYGGLGGGDQPRRNPSAPWTSTS